ncbi:MAG: hypothetical protein Q9222_001149 [Ikaeria aurantiellina]
MLATGIAVFLGVLGTITSATSTELPVKLEVKRLLNSRSANVHLSQHHESLYPFTVTYGGCHHAESQYDSHHTISKVHDHKADRLIWLLPEDVSSHGCLSAWSSQSELLGRSQPVEINKNTRQWIKKRHLDRGTKLSKRASIPMTNASGIDAEGPWFDGVEALKDKEIATVDATAAKAKQNRRVHTAYLSGDRNDYQYQEMGPMRFPETITYTGSNESIPVNDMKLVFQLADTMNALNSNLPNKENFTVNFIPWIQESPNGLYYYSGFKKPDTGLPPTVTELKAMSGNMSSSMQAPVDPQVNNITDRITEVTCSPAIMAAAAKNVFTAYKAFVTNGLGIGVGGDDWSEYAYFHNYLKYDLNATDQAVNTGEYGGAGGDSLWDLM